MSNIPRARRDLDRIADRIHAIVIELGELDQQVREVISDDLRRSDAKPEPLAIPAPIDEE